MQVSNDLIIQMFLFQIAAIVLAAIYSNEAESHTKEFFQHTIRKYYTTKDRRDAVTLSWDFMMAEVNTIVYSAWQVDNKGHSRSFEETFVM